MGVGQWMRVLDTVSGLVQMSGRFRRAPEGEIPAGQMPGGGLPGQLEARLAGVVVAALKEAFDRDRVRMDFERSQLDAERQRGEDALRAELRRQAADRALGQLRLVAVMAFVICMLSVGVGVWLPGMRALPPRALMGLGLALAIAALGCAFAAWQDVSAWSADLQAAGPGSSRHRAATTAPWLLLASLALVGGAFLSAL
jgi:hypothetical protein